MQSCYCAGCTSNQVRPPVGNEQQLIDNYTNKIIYSGSQLIQERVMALSVISKTSSKTRNTL